MATAFKNNSHYTHSVVADQRWIQSDQLELGMYVCELDIPWEQSTFMFQGFYLESMEDIREVQRQTFRVKVRTEKVVRINPNSYTRLCGSMR